MKFKVQRICLCSCIALMLTFVFTSVGLAKGGPPSGTGDEGAGNCLSFPVIWSDSSGLDLQGDPLYPVFNGEATIDSLGVPWYHQQDELNRWQAESINGPELLVDGDVLDVSMVDWGDNLEAKSWYENSFVRIETVLYQDLSVGGYTQTSMDGYTMSHLFGDGPDEMWGTNGITYESQEATVYSSCARLSIQRLPDDIGSLEWEPESGLWEENGVPLEVIFNGGVFDDVEDGPGGYSAEINVSGKVIYGYNWMLRKTRDGAGNYRITFSLAPLDELTTSFATTTIKPFSEEEEVTEAKEPGDSGEPVGGVTVMDNVNNLTYIDITILERSTGGGGQGGKPSRGGRGGSRGNGTSEQGNKGRSSGRR